MTALQQRNVYGVSPWLVTSYDQQLPTGLSNAMLGRLCELLLDSLSENGWTVGWIIRDAISRGDFAYLVTAKFELYDLGLSADDVYILAQCLAFFTKRQDIVLEGVDPEAAALVKFDEAEEACRVTNTCFQAWRQGRFQFHPEVEAVLHMARSKIARVLGDAPSLRSIRPRFGPGANTQVQKKNACLVTKLERVPSCSANFVDPESAFKGLPFGHLPDESQARIFADDDISKWRVVDFEIHVAQLEFAAKNAKIKRVIVKEPSLNGLYQLGLGDDMARRIRAKTGIDIRDQTRNQRAALYGSISGKVATLDMSSASDTQALGLIDHLYSPDWMALFEGLRSHRAVLRDETGKVVKVYDFEKVSSMGNGFTFPLETLTFWALAQSVSDRVLGKRAQRPVLVYGDDIVVESEVAEPLMRVLMAVGFLPNMTKSYWTGSFRESCGSDYVYGSNVRPVAVDDALTGQQLFTLHNFFHERGMLALALVVEKWIHPSIRLRGPKGYGDGHLHSAVWVSRPVTTKGWSGFTFETWTFSINELTKKVADRVLMPVQGKKDRAHRRRDYHPGTVVFVRRLASYVAYRSGVSPFPGLRHARYHDHVVPDADKSVASVWETPGKGPLKRTKVYTFEPPWLH